MKKVYFLMVAALLGATGCSKDKDRSNLTDPQERRTLHFDANFTRINVQGNTHVHITQADFQHIEVVGPKSKLDKLDKQIVGDTWHIRGIQGNATDADGIHVYITMMELKGIDAGGIAQVSSDTLDGDRIEIISRGNATTILVGTYGTQTINLSGNGKVNHLGLQTRHTTVDVSGTGLAEVNVTDSLDVNISGSGSVHYLGDPVVNQKITGTGELKKL